MESAWAARHWEADSYPVSPTGDPVLLSREMLDRWGPLLDDPARYRPPAPAGAPAAIESADDAR
jgi:hypothetical protein